MPVLSNTLPFGSSLFAHGYLPEWYLVSGVIQCSLLLSKLLVNSSENWVLIGKELFHWSYQSVSLYWVCVCFLNEKCRCILEFHLTVSPVRFECDHVFSSEDTSRTLRQIHMLEKQPAIRCEIRMWQHSNSRSICEFPY